VGRVGCALRPVGTRPPSARKFIDYVERRANGLATIYGTRVREDGVEAILLKVHTNRPQRPAIPILSAEPVAVCFLRKTESPRRSWRLGRTFRMRRIKTWLLKARESVVRRRSPLGGNTATWTSAELLHRIMRWFERAGMGELQDNRQPLDPFSPVTRSTSSCLGTSLKAPPARRPCCSPARRSGDHIVAEPYQPCYSSGMAAFFSFLFYRVEPRAMARMRHFQRHWPG